MSRALQTQVMGLGETRIVSVDYQGKLSGSELLTGSVTVAALNFNTTVTTTNITASMATVSTTGLTINGSTVATGQAAQCKVVAAAIGKYDLKFTVTSNSTPAQTFVDRARLDVKVD